MIAEASDFSCVASGRSFNSEGIRAISETEFIALKHGCAEQSLLTDDKNFDFTLDVLPDNRKAVHFQNDL